MPPERGVFPLARGMMHAGMFVMRAAGGGVPAETTVSRLSGEVPELPRGVLRLVRGADC